MVRKQRPAFIHPTRFHFVDGAGREPSEVQRTAARVLVLLSNPSAVWLTAAIIAVRVASDEPLRPFADEMATVEPDKDFPPHPKRNSLVFGSFFSLREQLESFC